MTNNLVNLNNLIDTFFLMKKEAIKSKKVYYFSYLFFGIYLIIFATIFIVLNILDFSLLLKIILDIVLLCIGFLLFLKLKQDIRYKKISFKLNKEKMIEIWVLVFEIKKYLSEEEEKDFIAIRNIDFKLHLIDPNI